jgi:hypothetical protein
VIELYHNDSWVDISSVVTKVELAIRNSRNRDFSMKAESFRITVAWTIKDLLVDESYEFSVGSQIKISHLGDFLFCGYIDVSDPDYNEMVFSITVVNDFKKLSAVIIQYATLHSLFLAGIQWYEYNGNAFSIGAAVVGIPWMLQCMFQAAGLLLDVSELNETVLFTRQPEVYPFVGFSPAVAIKYKHLFIIEEMLWCINQGIAVSHELIDQDGQSYNKNKINCFDLIKDIPSYLNFAIRQTGLNTFKAVPFTENSEIAPELTWDYSKTRIRHDFLDSGITTTFSYNPTIGPYKVYPTVAEIIDYSKGTGKESITILNNFNVFFSDAENKENHYDEYFETRTWESNLSSDFIITVHEPANNSDHVTFNPFANKIAEKIKDVTREVTLTNYLDEDDTTIQHSVDLTWDNSEIIQEVFSE